MAGGTTRDSKRVKAWVGNGTFMARVRSSRKSQERRCILRSAVHGPLLEFAAIETAPGEYALSTIEGTSNNPFAPPRADVADVPISEGPVLATRWQRLGGALIDVLVVIVALWVASKITPWNPFDPAKANYMRFALMEAVFGFVLFVIVQGYPLLTASQTWGKKLIGTRIVRTDGSPIAFGRLVGLRYGVPSLFGIVPALGQLWGLVDALFIFRESRRCLHDQIADTIVIKI
jgi:uncharacterized RDD family membrane protein YckC